MDEKNNSEKKKRFTAPEQIKFTKEISVKSLPKTESIFTLPSQKPQSSTTSPISGKTVESEKSSLKSTLRPEDIKLSLKSKINRIQEVDRKITIKPSIDKLVEKEKIPVKVEIPIEKEKLLIKPAVEIDIEAEGHSIEPIKFKIHEPNLTDEIVANKEFNIVNELHQLIVKRGGTLNSSLCERFISELLNSLKKPLKLEDLKYAAESFVRIEKNNFYI